MSEWTVIRCRKETKEKLNIVKKDFQKELLNQNKFRLDIPLKATDDMTLQRLLKYWFR